MSTDRVANPRHYDVAIAGGGLVGASLACALEPLGLKVAVLEAVAPRASAPPSFDDRTLALNHASCRILEGLGLWPDIESSATPIRRVIVTELDRPGRVELDPAEMDTDVFGHVVEARAFGAAVMGRLEALSGVDFHCPARVTGLVLGEQAMTLDIEAEGESVTIETQLLVGADGAHSTVRELLGLSSRGRDYGQSAVICNVMPEQPHEGRAFEKLTPTGPFAMLPHVGGRCGLVWSVPTPEAERLLALPDEAFLEQATLRSGGELGQFTRLGKRVSYPLALTLAERDLAPRALLLGNAAHAIHPVGAQGFNLGLRDVAVLAEVLQQAMSDHAGDDFDAGAEAPLEDYSRWRAPDQRRTAAWTDGLVGLFGSPSMTVSAARSIGLLAHSVVPGLRRRLAGQAMGYSGRVPRLALGEPL